MTDTRKAKVLINDQEFVPISFVEDLQRRLDDAANDLVAAMYLVSKIRHAIGDKNGKLMQDELVEKCRQYREELERWKEIACEEDFEILQQVLKI